MIAPCIRWQRAGRDWAEKMTYANHIQRQFLEFLRGRGWVKGSTLPETSLIASLLEKGWLEQQLQPPKNDIFYRMTDVGLTALKARVPTGRMKVMGK